MNKNILDIANDTIITDWKDVIVNIIKDNNINFNIDDNTLPNSRLIFECFNYFNINDLKVIILGQDPYQNEGYANGLAFSVPSNIKLKNGNVFIPASLKNIFKELERCYNIKRTNAELYDWSKQGVLLLNTALTVSKNNSGSDINKWKIFTHKLLEWISLNCNTKLVMICWGAHAMKYSVLFNKDNHKILNHSHPSPLSRIPFVGNNNFIDCNNWLEKPIIWL
jgi:uracil-DNA glycosylase